MTAKRRANAGARVDPLDAVRHRHLKIGWWSLLLFVGLGFALEAFHGLKLDWYLNVANQTRRLMWTLAHAHGTLLALVHLAFAATLSGSRSKGVKATSACLTAATLLLPGGFFLGGIWIYDGDPGLGVLLVPAGGVALMLGLLLRALHAGKSG